MDCNPFLSVDFNPVFYSKNINKNSLFFKHLHLRHFKCFYFFHRGRFVTQKCPSEIFKWQDRQTGFFILTTKDYVYTKLIFHNCRKKRHGNRNIFVEAIKCCFLFLNFFAPLNSDIFFLLIFDQLFLSLKSFFFTKILSKFLDCVL